MKMKHGTVEKEKKSFMKELKEQNYEFSEDSSRADAHESK